MIARALLVASLALAATSGVAASIALSQSSPPASTVTIDVGGTGPAGPPGPPGPPGPKGDPGTGGSAESCPAGSTFKAVRINTQGGHVTIWTCVAAP